MGNSVICVKSWMTDGRTDGLTGAGAEGVGVSSGLY